MGVKEEYFVPCKSPVWVDLVRSVTVREKYLPMEGGVHVIGAALL